MCYKRNIYLCIINITLELLWFKEAQAPDGNSGNHPTPAYIGSRETLPGYCLRNGSLRDCGNRQQRKRRTLPQSP